MANAPEYQKYDYNADYEQAKKEQQKAQDAAYNSAVSELNAQSDKLSQQYDSARQQIYKNSLISAQGAREVMAARGLTSSGVSETSNIRRQIALQNSLNQANLQEQNQKNDIAQKIIQAGYTRDQNMAQYLAQAILSKSNAQAQEHQYAASYDFNAWQAQQEADRYQMEFSYNKAMNEVSTFGRIITQEAADALGLPIGTSSYAVQQAEGRSRSRSSGGNSGGGDNKSAPYVSGTTYRAIDIARNELGIILTPNMTYEEVSKILEPVGGEMSNNKKYILQAYKMK